MQDAFSSGFSEDDVPTNWSKEITVVVLDPFSTNFLAYKCLVAATPFSSEVARISGKAGLKEIIPLEARAKIFTPEATPINYKCSHPIILQLELWTRSRK